MAYQTIEVLMENPTTRKVLDMAQEMFLTLGYGQVEMKDVAARSGISRSTLYRHFPSKEALAFYISMYIFQGQPLYYTGPLPEGSGAFGSELGAISARTSWRATPTTSRRGQGASAAASPSIPSTDLGWDCGRQYPSDEGSTPGRCHPEQRAFSHGSTGSASGGAFPARAGLWRRNADRAGGYAD